MLTTQSIAMRSLKVICVGDDGAFFLPDALPNHGLVAVAHFRSSIFDFIHLQNHLRLMEKVMNCQLLLPVVVGRYTSECRHVNRHTIALWYIVWYSGNDRDVYLGMEGIRIFSGTWRLASPWHRDTIFLRRRLWVECHSSHTPRLSICLQ